MHEPSDTYQIPYVIGLRTGIVQGSRHSAITHITKTRKNGRVQKPVPILSESMIHTVHSEVYITFTYINHCQWNTCSEPEILVLPPSSIYPVSRSQYVSQETPETKERKISYLQNYPGNNYMKFCVVVYDIMRASQTVHLLLLH